MPPITCTGCTATREAKTTPAGMRVPQGWKRLPPAVYCGECWGKRYVLRALAFPVDSVTEGGTWQDFCRCLHDAWSHSTALANWAVRELAMTDVRRLPGVARMPAMPATNLYRLFGVYSDRAVWDGATQSANSLLRTVEQRYRRRRLAVHWLRNEALATYRYPYPYPVHNAAWSAAWEDRLDIDGRSPSVSVPLGGQRFTLRLRGGYNMRRQLAGFAQVIANEAVPGELALYRCRATPGGRRTAEDRRNGGGNRVSYRIMCKMVAWLPRPSREQERADTMTVRTGTHALLVAQSPRREEPWILRQRRVARWIRAHAHAIECMADDSKAETRRPRRERIGALDRYDRVCDRFRNRIDNFIDTAAAWLANFADRQNVAAVTYDDTERGYFNAQSFPWAQLRSGIARRLDDLGIAHDLAGESDHGETDDDQPIIVNP